MKISNLRVERKEGFSYLIVDVKCQFTNNNKLWISVPSEYEGWFSNDTYDSFLVAALYPSMFYNEPIEIDGNVSPRLLFNVRNYVQHAIRAYRKEMCFVNISVNETKCAKQSASHVATGFSGGIDAFSTIIDRYENELDTSRRIDTFMCFNVGSHGGGRKEAREKFNNRFELAKGYPEELNIPYIKVDSNLFGFYKNNWEYYAGTLTRCFAILAFQRAIKYYYLSGEFSYREYMDNVFNRSLCNIDEMTELYMLSLLSTEVTEIILEGGQYNRMERTIKVADYAPARRYLNVCVDHWGDNVKAENCSHCFKCTRTMKALDVIGKLDDFAAVFDVQWYRTNKKKLWLKYMAGDEDNDPFKKGIIEYAKATGFDLPTKIETKIYTIGRLIYHPFWKMKKYLEDKIKQ